MKSGKYVVNLKFIKIDILFPWILQLLTVLTRAVSILGDFRFGLIFFFSNAANICSSDIFLTNFCRLFGETFESKQLKGSNEF